MGLARPAIGPQLDLSVGVRELEGVLEKVGQGGQKEISVRVDPQASVYVLYFENATLRVRLQLAGILGICNERGYRQGFTTFGGADSYIVDRASDQAHFPIAARLRFKSAPVAPLTGMFETSRALSERFAADRELRSS